MGKAAGHFALQCIRFLHFWFPVCIFGFLNHSKSKSFMGEDNRTKIELLSPDRNSYSQKSDFPKGKCIKNREYARKGRTI